MPPRPPQISDAAPTSSTVLVADTGDKPLLDRLSNSPEESSLWEKAYNAATPKTKEWIDGVLKSDDTLKSAESTQTKELIEIVQDMEKRHQDHGLQIQIGEKHILWKDYASRVISFIKAIGDIVIQFAPAPSGIIWSALKTVLQVLYFSKIPSLIVLLRSLSDQTTDVHRTG